MSSYTPDFKHTYNKRKATPVYTTQEGSWELKPQQPYRFELDSLAGNAVFN